MVDYRTLTRLDLFFLFGNETRQRGFPALADGEGVPSALAILLLETPTVFVCGLKVAIVHQSEFTARQLDYLHFAFPLRDLDC